MSTDPNAQILAKNDIDIFGDFARTGELSSGTAENDTGDPGHGTVMHLHGVIAHGAAFDGLGNPTGNLTRIFGNADTDQIFFDQTFLGGLSGTATSAIPGGQGQTLPTGGFTVAADKVSDYASGMARAYGSNTPTPVVVDNFSGTLNFAQSGTGDTIERTDVGGSWLTDGFAVGDIIKVLASLGNDRSYTIVAVTATILTLSSINLVTPGTNVSATVRNNKYAPAGDSEDFFVVNQLQSMVIDQETTTGVETGDTLTLDGQSASDTYVVNSTGTHGDIRNYVVNVLDTGDPTDGVDNLSVYGRDDNAANDPTSQFRGDHGSFDDIFLLRRTTGIANETPDRPVLYADDSAFVAVLDFDPSAPGNAFDQTTASDPAGDATLRSQSVQRINYDSSVNGRLMAFGQGGNDLFAVDDNAAVTTLDGGADNDTFQIGQLYGLQRDGSTHSPAPLGNTFGGSVVTPYDQFPQLVNSLTPQSIFGTVATTRGWLSAGATSPLVAEGGAGDDNFTVYSNQSPLRLEGDDGNDKFTVRAFALAQTDPVTGDIVWLDPVQMIALPKLTKGFSTAAETAIRTGEGANQVEYNINAPVSVDGGAGFNKLIILGTEFADHIVVTNKGIFGAGLTVTYQNIQVLEVNALEGDDTIDVLSTPPGMAVRVIGGLGNDTINVAGDVSGDVVSRDINGTSSTINHRVTAGDPAYDGLVADGISLSVARPTQGQVIIDENVAGDTTPGFTDVREGGADDIYGVLLAHAPVPGTSVFVTVSAGMNPQDEHGNAGLLGAGDIIDTLGAGDSILVGTGILPVDYDRDILLNGMLVHVPARAIVLEFDDSNWDQEQLVHVHAVDDTLEEGDRTYAISHSVLSDDPSFDHAIVRNVEVTVHDNDQPGIVVTQLDQFNGGGLAKYDNHPNDKNSIVLEGDSTTEVTDLYAVELANDPDPLNTGTVVRVLLSPQDSRAFLTNDIDGSGATIVEGAADPRFGTISDVFPDQAGQYFVDFTHDNWNKPVFVTLHAVNDGVVEDPHDTTIFQSIDTANTTSASYLFAAVHDQIGDVRLDTLVLDDESAGVFLLESGGSTLVTAGTANNPPTTGDSYTIRLTSPPKSNVNVDVATDGQTDVNFDPNAANNRFTLVQTGGLQAIQLFTGNITLAQVNAHTWTLSLADGSQLGSWISDGFVPGQRIRIEGTGTADDNPTGFYTIATGSGTVTDQVITLTDAGGSLLPTVAGTFNTDGSHTVAVLAVNERGVYQGNVKYDVANVPFLMFTGDVNVSGATVTRTDIGSFINDNFAPGEIIRLQRADQSLVGTTFKILAVADSTLTLDAAPGDGTYDGASISKMLDSLRRTDGSSWLDSGFFEGQLVKISGLGTDLLEKVDLITGTDAGKLDLMVLTDHPAAGGSVPVPYSGRPLGGVGTTITADASVTQMAARVTFTPPAPKPDPGYPDTGNWYQMVTVPVIGDPYFDIQPGHENLRSFPKTAHLLSGIQGPLSVEGGATSEDVSLGPAILLPGEANGPQFNIPPQPPESQSIDTLNIYNDGTKGNASGTLTSTALTGFGMGADLDLSNLIGTGRSFGESGKYPGGISYGSISRDALGNFVTDASHSTIEVLNIFLGSGNDNLDVESTLIPGPDHNPDGTLGIVSEHGGITTVHGGGNQPLQMNASNGQLTPPATEGSNALDIIAGAVAGTGKLVRTDGQSWQADGFAVGQQVLLSIDGGVTGSYTITGFADQTHKPGSIMQLLSADGSVLSDAGNVTGSVTVTDWLAVASGQLIGGQTGGNFDIGNDGTFSRITRDDGLPWAALGFAAGQQVSFSIGGAVGNATVLGFDNASATSGFGSVLLLGGAALPSVVNTAGVVAVTSRNQVSGLFDVVAGADTSTVTRASGNWADDGFKKGLPIAVSGQPGVFTVAGVSADGLTLTLNGLLPAAENAPLTLGIVRIGGDHIVVNGSSEIVNGTMTVAAPAAGDAQGTTSRITRPDDGKVWDDEKADPTLNSHFAVGQQVAITAEFSFPSVVFARAPGGDTITRGDGVSWLDDGFKPGQSILLSGTTSTNGAGLTNNGSFTIAGVTDSTLTLTAVNTVVPTIGASEPVTIGLTGELLVTGFADGGTTLLVSGATLPRQGNVAMTVNIDAPLVVYGDTSQDGVWYNGKSYQSSSQGKFGSKPQPHMDDQQFTLATPSAGQGNPSATIAVTVGSFSNPDGTFGTIVDASAGWIGSGFLVGGLVTIDGKAVGEVKTLTANTLTLSGLTPDFLSFFGTGSHTVKEWNTGSVRLASGAFDPGFVPEGLITIGQTYTDSIVFQRNPGGDTITRTDGGSWLSEGFAAGETISISGTQFNDGGGGAAYMVTGATASTLTLAAVNLLIPTPTGPGETARITADIGTVAQVGSQYGILFTAAGTGDAITRTDGGNWTADGFVVGQSIAVNGTGAGGVGLNNRIYRIAAISGDGLTITLNDANGNPLANSVADEGPELAIITGGKKDTLFLINLQPAFLTLLNSGGADGSRALESTIVERNRLGQNADFFVFPLANSYTYSGNDVIDARNLFADIPAGQLPTVGITAYGGAGDDTIIGSQAGDHLAGGSGNDAILGERGGDHIYGDSGFNVDVITRVLTVAQTAGYSGATNLDPLTAGNDLIYGEFPGAAADSAADAFGDNNDVIFGDLGDITQATAGRRDTTKPLVSLTTGVFQQQRIETTLLARTITSESRQIGGNDTIYGNGGEDILIGGAGNDAADGGVGRDLVFGDDVTLDRSAHLGNYSSLRFETLQGTQIYSTAPTNAGEDLASGDQQADPRGHGAWGDYLITLFDTLPDLTQSVAVAQTFGDDYIAGGPADDMLFGQAGDDVVQGDGSIDYVSHVISDNGDGTLMLDPSYPIGGLIGVINTAPNIAGNPFRDANNALFLRPSFDAAGDGQDYIEGGAGNDIAFGNQGQDDLVGGNSDMFSLGGKTLRPDGSDLIFGGSGITIARNAIGDAAIDGDGNITTSANGHANDADTIVGDNGDIIRLVGVNGVVAPPVGAQVVASFQQKVDLTDVQLPAEVQSFNGFLQFNYDTGVYDSAVKIVAHAVRLIDYTPGGVDFDAAAVDDVGAADEVHGESGDDVIYGQVGSDVLYGEGQNDTMIGGYGNDWMSGGTGDDGMLGADGRIFLSRNSLTSDLGDPNSVVSIGEPLYGVAPLLPQDPDPKYSNGNALNEFIFTPGQMQIDTINVSGALKFTVDITPFSQDPSWNGLAQPPADEFSAPGDKQTSFDSVTRQHDDDIMFGGLGNDTMHGGSGDDAMSGAEALPVSYTQIEDADHNVLGIAETDYGHPFNPSDALRFQSDDPNAKHPRLAGRTGEFALYDENDPLRIVLLNSDGTLDKTTVIPVSGIVPSAANQFFIDFNQNEGVFVHGGVSQQNGNQTVTFGPAHDDGNDAIFGDNGNDWIVGGTGRDHTYGGWGNDLLNADDNQTTDGGLNDQPETQPTYEDRAYGGAGKDVLIANTGGDRLIDWVGEYNSYLVPFSPFGMATVSRTLQPQLHSFLYAESLSDGVDPTRFSDLNGGATPPGPVHNDPNPGRNGEPAGELGLVLQQDEAWHGQTGAPTDPQAGNLPGTQRDVLRSANFTGNGPSAMFVDSGTWSISGSTYQNSASSASGDNVSLFGLDTWLPSFYEVQTTLKVRGGGAATNGFIVFDYQDAADFKFAGIDPVNGLLKIGQRDTTGWHDLATLAANGLKLNKPTSIQLTANFMTATLTFGGNALSYNFNTPLNTGMTGFGTNNSTAQFTSYVVQRAPIVFTYSVPEDFSDGVADKFTPQTGSWTATSGLSGRYSATPPAGDAAIATRPLAVAPLSYLEYSATVNAAPGAYAGLIFSETSTGDFLFAAIIAGSNQVVLGHRTGGDWFIDASAAVTITPGTDYNLLVALTEETTNSVNVVLNGKSVVSLTYNFLTHDGQIGLFARNGSASFDNVLIRGDDQAYASGGTPQAAATTPAQPVAPNPLSAAQLSLIVDAAKELWTQALGVADPRLAVLNEVNILVSDLSGGLLGATTGTTIVLDTNAAGWGWFVDPAPLADGEFPIRLGNGAFAADPASPAAGHIDLLSTVLHELGNAMGFAEDAGQDVTGATLSPGVRRLPTAAAASTEAATVGATATAVTVDPSSNGAAALVAAPVAANAILDLLSLGLAPALTATIAAAAGPATNPNPVMSAAFTATAGGADPGSPAAPHLLAGDPSGSFVALDAPLDWSSDDTTPPAPAPADTVDNDATVHHGSRTNASASSKGSPAAVIAWDSGRADSISTFDDGTGSSPDWLDNFLNHLGQDETVWNPNAAIRLRPTQIAAAT